MLCRNLYRNLSCDIQSLRPFYYHLNPCILKWLYHQCPFSPYWKTLLCASSHGNFWRCFEIESSIAHHNMSAPHSCLKWITLTSCPWVEPPVALLPPAVRGASTESSSLPKQVYILILKLAHAYLQCYWNLRGIWWKKSTPQSTWCILLLSWHPKISELFLLNSERNNLPQRSTSLQRRAALRPMDASRRRNKAVSVEPMLACRFKQACAMRYFSTSSRPREYNFEKK